MITQAKSFLSEILSEEPISIGNRIYFRERLKGNLHKLIVELFLERERQGKITRADLARKIGKRPEQITRILNTSGNLRLSTLSDVLLGLGYEPHLQPIKLEETKRNYDKPDWLKEPRTINFSMTAQQFQIQTKSSVNSKIRVLESQ